MERIINLTTRSAIEMHDMGFNLIMGPNANLEVYQILSYTSDAYVGRPIWTSPWRERYQITKCGFGYNYFPTVSLGDASLRPIMMRKHHLNTTGCSCIQTTHYTDDSGYIYARYEPYFGSSYRQCPLG